MSDKLVVTREQFKQILSESTEEMAHAMFWDGARFAAKIILEDISRLGCTSAYEVAIVLKSFSEIEVP